jgi:hypothetical protein
MNPLSSSCLSALSSALVLVGQRVVHLVGDRQTGRRRQMAVVRAADEQLLGLGVVEADHRGAVQIL